MPINSHSVMTLVLLLLLLLMMMMMTGRRWH